MTPQEQLQLKEKIEKRIARTQGEIEELNDHPLYDLFKKPNRDQSMFDIIKMIAMHLELTLPLRNPKHLSPHPKQG